MTYLVTSYVIFKNLFRKGNCIFASISYRSQSSLAPPLILSIVFSGLIVTNHLFLLSVLIAT